MARVPTDASEETQIAVRDLNDEIRLLRAEISRLSSSGKEVDVDGINDAIARAAQSNGPLDVNDVFRGSGGAHSIGHVPDPGADTPTYDPPNRFLHESGKWLPPVASSYRIGNDPTLRHNIPGHLNVAGGISSSKVTTGSLFVGGKQMISPPGSVIYNHSVWTHNSTGNALKVGMDTTSEDSDGMADLVNDRLVCKTAGVYLVQGQLAWNANATGRRILVLYVDGAAPIPNLQAEAVPNASAALAMLVSGQIRLAVNQYVELWAYQASGGNLAAYADLMWLSAQWLRP